MSEGPKAPRVDQCQTELPPDYVELEKRVDALKQVHQKLVAVTYVSSVKYVV